MKVVQHFIHGTIVRYKTYNSIEDGEDDSSKMILNCVFWDFKPCIEGFQYCKPIAQVDDTFFNMKILWYFIDYYCKRW